MPRLALQFFGHTAAGPFVQPDREGPGLGTAGLQRRAQPLAALTANSRSAKHRAVTGSRRAPAPFAKAGLSAPPQRLIAGHEKYR